MSTVYNRDMGDQLVSAGLARTTNFNKMGSPPSATKLSLRPTKLKIHSEDGESFPIETLDGKEYLVVPAIILVEGVLWSSNASDPALALSSEFGIFPQSWNGRPVVYNHPKVDGEAVSANSPAVWNSEVIGFLFQSDMVGKKLRTQAWLSTEKTPKEVFDILDADGSLEVSTGLYALEERKDGFYAGEEYNVIWRNIVPDHLAILPPGTIGACSITDGCGAPRINQSISLDMSTITSVKSPEKLAKESHMKATASAAPAVSAAATTSSVSPSSPTVVDPKANCGGCPGAALLGDQPTGDMIANADKPGFVQKMVNGVLKALGLRTNELSDQDTRDALQAALKEMYEGTYFYIVAVFSDTFVYSMMDSETYSWCMYQCSYSVSNGTAVTVGSDMVEVRAETAYVPLNVVSAPSAGEEAAPIASAVQSATQSTTQPKGNDMNQQTSAAATETPAAPTATPITASAAAPVVAPTPTPAPAPVANIEPAQVAAPIVSKAKTLEELLDMADETVKGQLNALMAANKARQTALIKALQGKTEFTDAELEGFVLGSLEKMAKAIVPNDANISFAGAAGGNTPVVNQGAPEPKQEEYTPAARVFEFNPAAKSA